MDRRRFLQAGAGVGAAAIGGLPGRVAQAQADDWSLYDITGRDPDANGLILPEGFTSRIVAHSNEPIEGLDYVWHVFPDGGATFETEDGGWIYASNSELPGTAGGVSALVFDGEGTVVDAYRILEGTGTNCAGGPTPWGTWLSCEEHEQGRVWECDPTRPGQGTPLSALGTFVHEAVAVDDEGERLFLTEDRPDGRFYRFTPTSYPDLSEGDLEVAKVEDGAVTWLPVPDPTAAAGATRTQVPESTAFAGGEGIVIAAGAVFFTTKGDNSVWRYDLAEDTLDVVYDGSGELRGVDNIAVTPAGDLLVAEDGDNLELMLVGLGQPRIQPMLRCSDAGSELCGPAFDPSGTRLYVSSQRGGPGNVGRTYEITGPFGAAPSAPTTESDVAGSNPGDPEGGDSGNSWLVPTIGGGAAVLVGAAAVWRLRTRTADATDTADTADSS